MVVIHVPRNIGTQVANIETHVRRNLISNAIYYIIDRKYRKVVNLQKWLKEQVKEAEGHEGLQGVASVLKSDTDDKTMKACLDWVRKQITYTTDDDKWDMEEKWEGVIDVYNTRKGDCESGALLMYCLARLAGVSESKVWIQCGSVNGGGHAWIGYIPDEYPLNFTFMDWCYWYKKYSIEQRNKFTVSGQGIFEYAKDGNGYRVVDSNYYRMWFVFNEETSYRSFR